MGAVRWPWTMAHGSSVTWDFAGHCGRAEDPGLVRLRARIAGRRCDVQNHLCVLHAGAWFFLSVGRPAYLFVVQVARVARDCPVQRLPAREICRSRTLRGG